jgi:hypothetical protein
MMWTCKLAVTPSEVKLLVRSDNDLLKARLPAQVRHPRALLTMLEGLALWSGSAICAAISADESAQIGCALGLFGDGLWPADNQLVRFEPAGRASPRRLRGMGDFRALRQGRGAVNRRER